MWHVLAHIGNVMMYILDLYAVMGFKIFFGLPDCGRTSPAADKESEEVWALDFVRRFVVVVFFNTQ